MNIEATKYSANLSKPQGVVAFATTASAAIAQKDNIDNIVFMDKRIKPRNQSDETRSVRLGSYGWYFKTLGTWMDNKMKEELAPFGLSLNQFAIIMTILEQEGLTQAEIGQRVMQPSYATTRNIDKLDLQRGAKDYRYGLFKLHSRNFFRRARRRAVF